MACLKMNKSSVSIRHQTRYTAGKQASENLHRTPLRVAGHNSESWAGAFTPIISATGALTQDACQGFEDSLDYM